MAGGPDILIFDDDTHFAELLYEVASGEGYSVGKYYDGTQALAQIRLRRPRLVFLDIMMPGMDGLSICRALKGDLQTRSVKVIVASAKRFQADIDAVAAAGADHFFAKSGDIAGLREILRQFIGAPETGRACDIPAPGMPMRVRVWGCRSAGGAESSQPTPCVSLEAFDRLIIFDAGTGLAGLCAQPLPAYAEIWLLLSRNAHPESTGGLAGLRRLLDQGRVVKMGGPLEPARPVQQELHKALGPVSAYGQRFQAFSLAESGVNLFPGAAVYSMMTMHPGSAMAYRVECGGKSVVYCPATEMDPETDERTPSDFNEKLARLVRGADLLIMDARYKDEDYARSAGKGDGCGGRAVELALRRGVRRLLLFRMDARYSEQDLLMWENAIRAELQEQSASLRAEMSKPGLCVEL